MRESVCNIVIGVFAISFYGLAANVVFLKNGLFTYTGSSLMFVWIATFYSYLLNMLVHFVKYSPWSENFSHFIQCWLLIVDRVVSVFLESLMPWRKSGNRVRLRRRQVKSPDRRASDKEQFSLSLPIIRLCREMLQWGRASAKLIARGGICPSRQCRRQSKFFASGVNFSIFTHFFLFFSY